MMQYETTYAGIRGLSSFNRCERCIASRLAATLSRTHGRARRMRERLTGSAASITNAIYDAGFNSNSRFYEASDRVLGMRARDYRAGGTNAAIRFAVGQSSLGSILVAVALLVYERYFLKKTKNVSYL